MITKGRLYCEFCSKTSKNTAGKTNVLKGMNHLKKEMVKNMARVECIKTHNLIIAKTAPKETPLACAVSCACKKTAEREFKELEVKFTAYMKAGKELPFTKFTSQIWLRKNSRLDVSRIRHGGRQRYVRGNSTDFFTFSVQFSV